MQRLFQRTARRQAAFSLVELMVGVAIGMIAVVVIMQTLLSSERSKRATAGTDDAQTGGVIAITTLQRDLQQSGAGFSSLRILGCNITMPGGWILNNLAPATINHPAIPAGDPNSDTLVVVYGDDVGTPDGERILGQPSANTYVVGDQVSFAIGDYVIARPANPAGPVPAGNLCNLTMEQVRVANSGSQQVQVTTGTAGVTNGILFNLGRAPRILAYAVRNQALTVCDMLANDCSRGVTDPNVWAPIAAHVVSLRATYAYDSAAPNPSGIAVSPDVQARPASACGIMRTLAVRLALVTRSDQFVSEREQTDNPTTAPPTWTSSAVAPVSLGHVPDWQRFRYRLFQATVPLRNTAMLMSATVSDSSKSTLCGF